MRAVVTGASGLLGGNLAIALLDAGHEVHALRRGGSRVDHLARWPIRWVEGDLGDAGSLARAFEGADAVFHCAAAVSIVRRPTPELVEANVEGTRRVIAAVRACGVRRLVHCSTVGAVGLSDDGAPCSESSPWNFDRHGLADGYVITKHQAEELVRAEARAGGLDVVIANPTYMLGPLDRRPSSGRLIVEVVRGRVPGWTEGLNDFVDVRDVARGMLLVHDRGRAGERYILGGERLSYREIFERIAAVAGVRAPAWRAPRLLALALGWLGDLQERATGREPLINSVQARYGYVRSYVFSSDKARTELGYTSGPIEPAIRDAIAFFREVGML